MKLGLRCGFAARVVLTAALLLGCGRGSPDVPSRLRVTLIGIDGASWRVMDELLEAGELPHVAQLIETGVRAPLRSIRPLLSPPVWTTIATGRTRRHHGIERFNRPGGGLVSSRDRRVPALWTLASQAGLRVAVIGWWATYPAEAVAGVMISERALKTREDDLREMVRFEVGEPSEILLVHPPEVMETVSDLLRDAPELGDDAGAEGNEYEAESVPPVMRAEDAAVTRSLLRIRESHGPFDLELILLRGVDPVSHYFWKFREPDASVYRGRRPSAAALARYSGTIESHYRFVDGLLAELGRASPEHAILLLSDHGFEAGFQRHGKGRLSGTHKSAAALEGIFIASGGPFRTGLRLEALSILDVAPTTLHLLGLPVPSPLEGEVARAALEGGWRSSHPVAVADGYPALERSPDPGSELDTHSPVDEQIERELRALGYVE